MLYDEELILLSDSRLIKDGLYRIFAVIVTIWDNLGGGGLNYKLT
jgi:hypothetical protein